MAAATWTKTAVGAVQHWMPAALRRTAAGASACGHTAVRLRALATDAGHPPPTKHSQLRDDFLSATSYHYLESLSGASNEQEQHKAWRGFFDGMEAGSLVPQAYAHDVLVDVQAAQAARRAQKGSALAQTLPTDDFSARVLMLTRAFQVVGHVKARLDPLKLYEGPQPPELQLSSYGFTSTDLDRPIPWHPGEGISLPVSACAAIMSPSTSAVAPPVSQTQITLRKAVEVLEDVYCGSIGFEFMHIADRQRCDWIRRKIEAWPSSKLSHRYTPEEKRRTLDRLLWSELFETFCNTKYGAAKRFGLEGGESFVPGLKALIDRASELGVESVTIGMAHRGRLNVLANVVRKPLRQIFSEFAGNPTERSDVAASATGRGTGGELFEGTGDVKYHLGTSYDRPTTHGGHVHLSLLANPSHLEAVDPVVLGKVRAKQHYASQATPPASTLPIRSDHHADGFPDISDDTMDHLPELRPKLAHMPLLMHGDGSFAGQGVVHETLDMACLPGYETGGTIHVVLNNQVAFTTDPKSSRSTLYCTDVAKTIEGPIFHVNGDDVLAVQFVMELAAEYRQEFRRDVVVDVWCYRRQGHNEIDEPSFTQPEMYQAIKRHPLVTETYANRLIAEGVITDEEVEEMKARILRVLEHELDASKTHVSRAREWLASVWEGLKAPDSLSKIRNTGVAIDHLRHIGRKAAHIPDHVTPHRLVKKVYDNRLRMMSGNPDAPPVDWSFAEQLAFATLLTEGYHVRLSGQDVERGTFSQRHLVVHDQSTENVGKQHVSLCHLYTGQPKDHFQAVNSSLSEFGVLGFELGYSLENPNALVLWEAQFGDFANSAQIIFDQFLSSGESKWLRMSGLTVLLPHGYDGQGPEHSSARIERFLQMVDEDPRLMPRMDEENWFTGGHLGGQIQRCNWQIVNVTTPANYFHVLRRQMHRDFRKPLIVFSPKSLLRHPKCVSPLTDFDDLDDPNELQGPRFRRLIMDDASLDKGPDPEPKLGHVERLVFCSGKVYYDLIALRDEKIAGSGDPRACSVAICRIEQLSPFPFDLVRRELRRYPNAEVVFCQEEPLNMGPYWYSVPRINTCLEAVLGAPGASKESIAAREAGVQYAGRPPSASPATGFAKVHVREQSELCHEALGLPSSEAGARS